MLINEILKTDAAKRNFLVGLVFLSKADGVVLESEKSFFLNAAASLELSEESVNEINLCWTKDVMPELVFDSKKEKLFFLMQAIQLANVDNDYADQEKQFIDKIASDFGVSNDSVEKIEAWVKEGLKWQSEGDKLIDLEV